VPRRILFLPQIADRKRICDRRPFPDVVSGCDTASFPAREHKREDAPRRPGHLVNSILMCFCAPPGLLVLRRPIHDTTPLGLPAMPRLLPPHMCFSLTVYTLAATPDARCKCTR